MEEKPVSGLLCVAAATDNSTGLTSSRSANLGRLLSDTTSLYCFRNHNSMEMQAVPERVRRVKKKGGES